MAARMLEVNVNSNLTLYFVKQWCGQDYFDGCHRHEEDFWNYHGTDLG
jgi:hypothetical protein